MTQNRRKKGISRKWFIAGILGLAAVVVAAEVMLLTGVFNKKDKKKNTEKVTPTAEVVKPTEGNETTVTPTPDDGMVTVYRETVRYFMYNDQPYPGVEMTYNESGLMTEYREADQNGKEYAHIRYEYDEEDRLIKTERIEADGETSETVTRSYNQAGQILEIIYRPSENQHVSPEREVYEYDGKGRKIKEAMYGMDPEIFEYEIDYVYNEDGLMTDYYWHGAYGDSTEHYHYEYDAAGHETKSTKEQADGSFKTGTEKKYDGKGNVILDILYSEDGQWVATRMYDYDGDGNLTARYDLASEEPNADNYSSKTVYSYDEKGRLVRETMYYRDGEVLNDQGHVYDENGCLVKDVNYNPDGTIAGYIGHEYMAFSIPYEKLTDEDLEWYNREHK